MGNTYTIKSERGHYVVLQNGKFYGSYDTKHEAMKAIEEED